MASEVPPARDCANGRPNPALPDDETGSPRATTRARAPRRYCSWAACRSSARWPPRMPSIAMLPSWHANSNTGFVGLLQRDQRGPRTRPVRWIAEGQLPVQGVRSHSGKALLQAKVLGRAHEVALLRVVRRLDDQRIALPTRAGVTHPLPDPIVQMRLSVDWDDADVVDQLLQDSRDGRGSARTGSSCCSRPESGATP